MMKLCGGLLWQLSLKPFTATEGDEITKEDEEGATFEIHILMNIYVDF